MQPRRYCAFVAIMMKAHPACMHLAEWGVFLEWNLYCD
jgi:hypothetical protein